MDSGQPKSSQLRFYLMATFIPMLVLSLVAFAVLTHFQVGREIDKDMARRAQVEQGSFEQALTLVERELQRTLKNTKSKQDVLVAVMSRNPRLMKTYIGDWVNTSYFDSVTVYTDAGMKVGTFENTNRNSLVERWIQLLSTKAKLKKNDTREPSSEKNDSSKSQIFYDSSKRYTNLSRLVLGQNFRSFLAQEQSFYLREYSKVKQRFELVHYIHLLDSEKKSAGYLEARVIMGPSKLNLISDLQGVEWLILGPRGETAGFSEGLKSDLGDELFSEKKFDAAVKYQTKNFNLFTYPLTNEDQEPLAYAAVGLSRAEHKTFQRQLLAGIVIVGLFLSVVMSFLVVTIANKITRPITDLLGAVDAMKMGEWVHPVAVDNNSEIGLLVSRFNEMAHSVQVTKRTLETKLEELAKSSQQLAQTRDHLIQTEKLSSLGQLVAGVAHELNNPIAFIYSNMSQMKSYLEQISELDQMVEELLKKTSPEEQDRIRNKLEEIEWEYIKKDMADIVQSCLEGSNRVKDIVMGLRDFSRLDKGRMEECDIEEAFRKTANILRGQIKNKAEIHWNFCENNKLVCSPSQMNQVFMNLLSNAAQAISDRGEIWVSTKRLQDEKVFEIRVRDNGAGIAPENLKKIFDPFFTTKKVGDGTGLGLSIVYGIIERHKGSIEVQSQRSPSPQHGTEFIIRLPLSLGTDLGLEKKAS